MDRINPFNGRTPEQESRHAEDDEWKSLISGQPSPEVIKLQTILGEHRRHCADSDTMKCLPESLATDDNTDPSDDVSSTPFWFFNTMNRPF